MRATTLAICALAFTLAAACQSETGIVINTKAGANLADRISAIRYYVGKNSIGDPLYYADSEPLDDIPVDGRDLSVDPYRLLLSPGSDVGSGDEFVVAALAIGANGRAIGFGHVETPLAFMSGKVLEWDLEIGPAGGDIIVTDTGCLKFQDGSGDYVHIGIAGDSDCDGVTVDDGDCNDLNPNQSPNQVEDCQNGIDDNCNGLIDQDDTADFDEDGFASCGPDGELDCNDNNEDMFPGNPEVCDGLDNDCDGLCDDVFDVDHDGISSCGSILSDGECVGETDPDCDDNDPVRFPGNDEVCDGIDNDCSGRCDDDDELDGDGDSYTSCGSVIGECGLSDTLVDCEPDDGDIHPGAQELCDGIDNNCDGSDAESSPCFVSDAGTCVEGTRSCDGGVLTPDCLSDAAEPQPVPGEVCTAYADCAADDGIPDPFSCVLDQAADQPVDQVCEVAVVGATTCPGNRVRVVPSTGPATGDLCSYSILGGLVQQGFAVALVGPDGSGQLINACTVDLEVSALPGASQAAINIFFDSGTGTTEVIRVKLKAHRFLACGANSGLSCDTWIAPPG